MNVIEIAPVKFSPCWRNIGRVLFCRFNMQEKERDQMGIHNLVALLTEGQLSINSAKWQQTL